MRIELTTPDGRKFEIKPDAIDFMEEALPGLYPVNVKAVIYIGERMQAVCETIEQIKNMEKAVNEQEALHRLHQSKQAATP